MRSSFTALLALVVAGGTIPIHAQVAPILSAARPSLVRSGTFDNPTTQDVVVFATVVTAPGAPWLRLAIDSAHLPGSSYIEVASLLDGYSQRLDAEALAVWENTSAYFNGDALFVRLIAGPNSKGVGFTTTKITAGLNVPTPPTICGTDNRTLSSDPRNARLMSVGCTAWIINRTNCFITAGHCCASGATVVQFNVPLSSSTGALRNPPPEDQYNVIASSRQFTNGGQGNDWCVFQTLVNTVTNLHAGQRQGQFYRVSISKPPVGNDIRVTGYGTVSSPVSLTWNQVQKTHVGPLRNNSGSALCYATDTTGGNSGSPVIDERSGRAVGVHTHGGCSSSGTGCNTGTSASLTAFSTALRPCVGDSDLLQAPPATIFNFGVGCRGSAGTPALNASLPRVGEPFAVELTEAVAKTPALLWLGRNGTSWSGMPLPLELSAVGMAGCHVYVAPETQFATTTDGAGRAAVVMQVPGNIALLGQRLLLQWLTRDANANVAGVTLSDAAYAQFGI